MRFMQRRLALFVALAATSLVTVTSAAAGTRPDDRPVHGPGAVAAAAAIDVARPDDRATHGPGAIAPITPIVAEAPSTGGFDWLDAGIGAAIALGLALVGLGAAALVLRQRENKRSAAVLMTFTVGLLAIVGAALATPGIGVVGQVQARGTIDDRSSMRRAGIELLKIGLRGEQTDIVTQSLSMAPGGTTGWHGHPGPVLVTIKSGELTVVYADDKSCRGTTYRSGQSFVDFGNTRVHTALNRGPVPVDFWATYFVPGAAGAPFRIDSPNPSSCSF